MAQTYSIAAANIASVVDNSEIRNIDTQFKQLSLHKTPLVAWVPERDPQYLGEDLTIEKIVDRMLPRTVTTTVAIVTADTDFTFSTSDAARLQVGHILASEGDGSTHNAERVRVTVATTGTTVTVTRGFGTVAANTHADTTVWRVLSPVYADGAAFTQSASSLGEFVTFLPFIVQYKDSVSPIRDSTRTYLEKNQDPLRFRLERLRKERMPEFEAMLLHGQTSTISASTAGSPVGIYSRISTNATAVSAALTATHIEDMLEDLYDWGGGDEEITVVGNNTMHRIWSAVWRQYYSKEGEPGNLDGIGFQVTKYYSQTLGQYVNFMRCEAAKTSGSSTGGSLLFLRRSSWGMHSLKGNILGTGWHEVERGVKETGTLGKDVLMWKAGVFVCDDERLNGKLTGITTTASSYSGYV